MSSAVIASTTPTASRFVSIEAFKLPRKPVTTISSSVSLCAASCANAGLISTAPPTMVNSALYLKRAALGLDFIRVVLHCGFVFIQFENQEVAVPTKVQRMREDLVI